MTPNSSNLDASPQQTALNTSYINIFDNCLKSDQTIFYLLIYYTDFATGVSQKQSIFFQYKISDQRQFVLYRLTYKQINQEFKNYILKKRVPVVI